MLNNPHLNLDNSTLQIAKIQIAQGYVILYFEAREYI